MWGSHNCLKRLGRLPRLPGNSTCPIFIRLHSHLISQTWMFPSKEEEASNGASLVFQCKSETCQQSGKSHNIGNVIKWSPGECDPWLVRPPQNHPPSTGIPPPFREFRHTKSLSLVELFTFYQSRNIDLVIAADCNMVSILLAWVPLPCANLPPGRDFVNRERGSLVWRIFRKRNSLRCQNKVKVEKRTR